MYVAFFLLTILVLRLKSRGKILIASFLNQTGPIQTMPNGPTEGNEKKKIHHFEAQKLIYLEAKFNKINTMSHTIVCERQSKNHLNFPLFWKDSVANPQADSGYDLQGCKNTGGSGGPPPGKLEKNNVIYAHFDIFWGLALVFIHPYKIT